MRYGSHDKLQLQTFGLHILHTNRTWPHSKKRLTTLGLDNQVTTKPISHCQVDCNW